MALGDFLFPHIELKLVIARSFEVDIEAVSDKTSKEYQDLAARVVIEEGDMKRLSLKDGASVLVTSEVSSVVVRAFSATRSSEGLAIMPPSAWSMALVPIPPENSPPQLHGISVTLKGTKEKVTTLDSLFESP
ncbi:MAG: molybdopterin dinucleotide binding domain-containing protein [Candidatus Hodarchaeota archaeon]